MECPVKRCGICGENDSNLRPNLMTLKTKYSGTLVYQLLERFVEYELSEQASSMIESAACGECYAKLNDYDAAYTKALIIQKELLDLLKNSKLGILLDYEVVDFTDNDGETDNDWQPHDTRDVEEESQDSVLQDEIIPKPLKISFRRGISMKCNACGTTFSDMKEMQSHSHLNEDMDENTLPSTSDSMLTIEAVRTEPDDTSNLKTESADIPEQFDDIKYATPTDGQPIEYFIEELEEPDDEHYEETCKKTKLVCDCYYCDENFLFKEDFKEHLDREHQLEHGKHKCKACGFLAKTRAALSSHFTKHSRPSITCPVCNKLFGQKASLQRHIAIHTGEKAFHCELCGKGYIHYSSFYMHQLAHKNIRGKKCGICGYALRSTSHLKRHMRTHSGEKPFECPDCGQKFSQRYNMVSHLKSHRGISQKNPKTFACKMCEEVFERNSQRKKHVEEEHGNLNDATNKDNNYVSFDN